jgi:hypothetical protein
MYSFEIVEIDKENRNDRVIAFEAKFNSVHK